MDCTTCIYDVETSNCKQGHFRNWYHSIEDLKGKRIPISDCHAWKGRCDCERIVSTPGRWWNLFSEYLIRTGISLDITCKKCGRKLR
jgi:hypothetical protein